MKLEIKESNCQRLIESHYNNNFYEMPITINGCNIIHEKFDGAEELEEMSIGNMEKGKYVAKFHFMKENEHSETFTIDSEKLSTENYYT